MEEYFRLSLKRRETFHKSHVIFLLSQSFILTIKSQPHMRRTILTVYFCITAALSSFHNRLSRHLKRLGSLVIGRVGGSATSTDQFRPRIPPIANSSTIVPTVAIYNPLWQLTTITIAAMCHWVYTTWQVYPFVVDL